MARRLPCRRRCGATISSALQIVGVSNAVRALRSAAVSSADFAIFWISLCVSRRARTPANVEGEGKLENEILKSDGLAVHAPTEQVTRRHRVNVVVKPDTLAINRTHMPHRMDAGLGARCRIGIIELSINQTSEHEFRRALAVPGVDYYVSRIPCSSNITRKSSAAMESDIENGTALIMPDLQLDVMGFTCTSGTMVIGEDKVFEQIRKVRPGIPCTSPITGALAGIKALGLRNVALLTPYVQEINDIVKAWLEARGVGVPVMGSFNNGNDDEVARITTASTRDAAIELGRAAQVDGIFVSCTSLRTLDIIDDVERAIGKPMIASNRARPGTCCGSAESTTGWKNSAGCSSDSEPGVRRSEAKAQRVTGLDPEHGVAGIMRIGPNALFFFFFFFCLAELRIAWAVRAAPLGVRCRQAVRPQVL